jgi:5S rRNA maturation endonuclease (ribonuclease M5)
MSNSKKENRHRDWNGRFIDLYTDPDEEGKEVRNMLRRKFSNVKTMPVQYIQVTL